MNNAIDLSYNPDLTPLYAFIFPFLFISILHPVTYRKLSRLDKPRKVLKSESKISYERRNDINHINYCSQFTSVQNASDVIQFIPINDDDQSKRHYNSEHQNKETSTWIPRQGNSSFMFNLSRAQLFFIFCFKKHFNNSF